MKAPIWAKHIKVDDTLLIQLKPSHNWYWREDLRGEIEFKVDEITKDYIFGYIQVPGYGEAHCNIIYKNPDSQARIIRKVKK